jgi:putative DNA primase/helicase
MYEVVLAIANNLDKSSTATAIEDVLRIAAEAALSLVAKKKVLSIVHSNTGLHPGDLKQRLARLELELAGGGAIAEIHPVPLCAEEIDALVMKAATDPGAPFESQTLARLAATKRADLATFIRLRARLKATKIKVGVLDKALAAFEAADDGKDDGGQGRAITFREIEPWPEPVDGATLLDEVVAQIQRYVTLPREAAVAVVLWIMHAYCFDAFTFTPRLGIISPVKRCGKTTLLRVLKALVPKPLPGANITAAATFRTIEKHRPTLLIDEADTFLPDNEELRGVINSGHERDGQVVRLVGENFGPSGFSTFCPTAVAAIGSLPGTIEDRAITITMRRRLTSEPVDRFRSDRAGHLHELARKAARWVADHEHALCDAEPDMPEALHDRACDNWRPLLAIADLAGGDWPEMARAAAQTLSTQGSEQDDQSRSVMLLADIRRVFDDRQKKGGKDADRVSSTGLVADLVALVDRPWSTWSKGKSITSTAVARLLKDFAIFPNTIKLSDGKQPNGYKRSQFDDAFARYLPQPPGSPVQSSPSSPTPANPGASGQFQGSPLGASGEVSEPAQSPEKQGVGEDGELSSPQTGSLDESGDTKELIDDNFDQPV